MSVSITHTELEEWLTARVLAYGKVEEGSFTLDTPLTQLGLDSVYALTLCGDIEDAYEIDVDPVIVWDFPTIRLLAGGLADQMRAAA